VPDARAPRWLILATRQLAARPAFAVLQASALAVGLLALVLLALLRTDLVSSWREATPKDAPNRFVINVQPPQADAFQEKIRSLGVTRYDWFPMIRGRLVAIDGKAVGPDDFADPRARRLVDREFNLSHSSTLPAHNLVSAGRWTADEKGGLSVEEGLADTLGLKLGQSLRFDLGGTPVEGRITSLRKVDWSSMRVNFFVLFAAVSATRESRAREFAVMRALGASARLLAQVQRAELLGVGALAGLLASIAAVIVSWALARWVFEFSWNPSPLVPLAGAVAVCLAPLSLGAAAGGVGGLAVSAVAAAGGAVEESRVAAAAPVVSEPSPERARSPPHPESRLNVSRTPK